MRPSSDWLKKHLPIGRFEGDPIYDSDMEFCKGLEVAKLIAMNHMSAQHAANDPGLDEEGRELVAALFTRNAQTLTCLLVRAVTTCLNRRFPGVCSDWMDVLVLGTDSRTGAFQILDYLKPKLSEGFCSTAGTPETN